MKRVLGLALTLALFASFTELNTAHAEEPPRAVYEALDQYFDYTIDSEALVTALENAGYRGGASGLFADLHAAGQPIPVRLLFDADEARPGSVDHYTQRGQLVLCGGQRMPGLGVGQIDQLDPSVTWLCNERTGEWTLFRRAVAPPVTQYVGPVRMDEDYCYYTHPNYQGTLTLFRGADPGNNNACPAAAP